MSFAFCYIMDNMASNQMQPQMVNDNYIAFDYFHTENVFPSIILIYGSSFYLVFSFVVLEVTKMVKI